MEMKLNDTECTQENVDILNEKLMKTFIVTRSFSPFKYVLIQVITIVSLANFSTISFSSFWQKFSLLSLDTAVIIKICNSNFQLRIRRIVDIVKCAALHVILHNSKNSDCYTSFISLICISFWNY